MSAIRRTDIVSVDLAKPLRRDNAGVLLATGDNSANRFGATIEGAGNLSSCVVTGYFIRGETGTTIVINGTVSGKTVYVDLPKACYENSGPFSLALRVTMDGVKTTVRIIDGYIKLTQTEWLVYPGGSSDDSGEDSGTGSTTVQVIESPTIYCWGDSLTEGVGGWLQTPEMVQKAIVSAYPDVVGQAYNCINLGCRGETIQTIMARQGADPMVVGGFTIPASSDESVTVGYLRGSYFDANRLGITTASGDLAQPLKETEAGINPCTIGGVEGELYRTMTADSDGKYTYLFRRLEDGTATDIPAGTTIETHAMKYYRNGVAVIWMGANGSVSSHTGFIQKVKDMVEYGGYSNYLVLMAREYTSQWAVDESNSIKAGLTDADGTCHFLYLYPELLHRGYTLAGIAASAGVPDTSGWTSTTDEIKLQAPLLMASTGTDESSYETLHFSCYGYKAIGKLVVEKLKNLLGSGNTGGGTGGSGDSGDSGSSGSGSGDSGDSGDTGSTTGGYEMNGTDGYGSFAFKLTEPIVGTGSTVNTEFVPYDSEKDWTIILRFADAMAPTDNSMGCIFEMREFFSSNSKQTAISLRKDISSGDVVWNFAEGFGGFNFPFDNCPGYVASTDGYHDVAIIKSGSNYHTYFDGGLAYGGSLSYAVSSENYSEEPLYLFGRVENGNTYNTTTGEIVGFRIYNSALSTDVVNSILQEMEG